MTEAVEGIASLVEQLNERVRELERRVSVLESQPPRPSPARTAMRGRPAIDDSQLSSAWRGLPSEETPARAVPVIGKSILAIAGAYLLRAIVESGSVPKLPVLIVAILYAGFWLVWAVRIHASNRFASATYGITSALILSPLLWEVTVRFQIMSPVFAGMVLVAFVVLALAVAHRRALRVIPGVTIFSTVLTALALIITTHELVPLTAALLAIAFATEIAVCLGRGASLRALPAFAADFAVWLLVYVATAPGGVPESYHPTAPTVLTILSLALLAIYGGSVGIRSFVLHQRITVFEIGQVVLAFVLATYGTMRATQGSAATALAVFFLLLVAVCYWGALSRFLAKEQTRNRLVSATWAVALLLAGNSLLFPVKIQVIFLCLATVVAAFAYSRTAKLCLGLHSSVFLAAAAFISPLPKYAVGAMTGAVPPSAPTWNVWIVAVSALLCYAVGSYADDRKRRRVLWVVPAALVSFAGAAFAVALIVRLFAVRVSLAASHLSVVRTVVNCALALTLGFLGFRWKRVELGWVAYAAVAFGTLKLLFEDLRYGNPASLVVSFLFYGLVLILLPRVSRT